MMANLLLCHIPVQNEIYIVSSYSTKWLIVLIHKQQYVHVCSSCSTLCEVELLNQSRCLTNKFLSTHADVRGPPKIFQCKMSSQDIQMQEVLPRYSEIVAGPDCGFTTWQLELVPVKISKRNSQMKLDLGFCFVSFSFSFSFCQCG